MVVCLDGHVGMRCWKAVKVIYVAIREERIAWRLGRHSNIRVRARWAEDWMVRARPWRLVG
jgi:hypothetical protein